MPYLTKLEVKTATRASRQDPVQLRRRKLVAAIEEQLNAADAAVNGETHEVTRKTWVKNEQGEKVLVDKLRKVRPWFFEQDGGWYVQCKYGNKALMIGNGNAVFVKALKEIAGALKALKAATDAGELDEAIAKATQRRKTK
ncbi:hypothetical protein [Ruegeria jejuensis]|uniref:hypothetical protein n=1 Tax=Ruegeria jejuensis TaxID=3233338 RepID=UPI00355BF102